jgi:hypothetical protein
MLTAQTEELLDRIGSGIHDPADTDFLGGISAQEFLGQLDSAYSLRFQERRLGHKWEVGAARSVRHEIVSLSRRNSVFPLLFLLPVLRRCLFVSGEDEAVTGIATATRLVLKPIWKPFQGLALTMGRGFKLDNAPDGWAIKPVTKQTTKLSEEFLRKRGWRFDVLCSPGYGARRACS